MAQMLCFEISEKDHNSNTAIGAQVGFFLDFKTKIWKAGKTSKLIQCDENGCFLLLTSLSLTTYIPCLPNYLMLNQWLNKKNNLSVFRFRIRLAKM